MLKNDCTPCASSTLYTFKPSFFWVRCTDHSKRQRVRLTKRLGTAFGSASVTMLRSCRTLDLAGQLQLRFPTASVKQTTMRVCQYSVS